MSTFSYIWPIALVVLSNIIYHICSKSVPGNLNPFVSLIVTYLIGAAASTVMYFVLNRKGDFFAEFTHVNWAPFLLGFAIVGLEVGNIYAYKNGWTIGSESIVQASFLAVALIIVGAVAFKEHITWNKVVGMVICLAGLVFINIK